MKNVIPGICTASRWFDHSCTAGQSPLFINDSKIWNERNEIKWIFSSKNSNSNIADNDMIFLRQNM